MERNDEQDRVRCARYVGFMTSRTPVAFMSTNAATCARGLPAASQSYVVVIKQAARSIPSI